MINTDDVEIGHDPINRKYDALYRDMVVGVVVYEITAGRTIITHAAIEQDHRGHGIGSRLISFALDDLQAQGRPIGVICPVVRAFIAQHPQYAGLLA